MLKEEVPQDQGIAEGLKEVCYAVGEDGRYVLVPSAGWEPKNITNYQAWDMIADQLAQVRDQVRAGKVSLLAFHMAKNQMDIGLLAQYSGFWRWRIRRHLKPAVFARLNKKVLERYAALFKTTPDHLTDPASMDNLDLPGRIATTENGPDHAAD